MKNSKIKNLSIKTASAFFFIAILCGFVNPVQASEITTENVTYLINQQRSIYGLAPLKTDTDLSHAATMKSRDMINRNYFEHYAYGLMPWDFINNAGYNYLYAGENLAMDFNTSEGMVNAWMNSALHRENILNPDFEDMGVGVVKGAYVENGLVHETTIVTNMFGRRKPPVVEFFNKVINSFTLFFRF